MIWTEFSWWVIFIGAAVQMGGGMLWYGPLFGKKWMQAMGIDPDDKEKLAEMQKTAGPAYGASMVFALIFSYVLDVLLASLAVSSIGAALLTAAVLWLAFTFANTSKAVLWGEMKRDVLIINSGFELVFFAVIAVVAVFF